MTSHGKQRRARRKRQEREHQRWASEQSGEAQDKRSGEFVVLLWPDMKRTAPMNHRQAVEVWRNHHDRAMIFRREDFIGNG